MPKCGRKSDVPTFEPKFGGMTQEFVNRNAPFGTNFTPTVRTKIIGGIPRQIKETQRTFKHPGLDPVEQETSKTTHDDGVQTDFDEHVRMMKNDHRQRQQPPRSPDWKSRPVLPPIQPSGDQLNFHHSQISPQQPKKNTTTSTNDSYQQHYGYNDKYLPPQTTKQSLNDHDRSSPTKQGDNSFQPKDYSEHGKPKEYDWKPAAGYSYLPTQPIALNKDQEMFLMHKLAMDMDEAACTVDQVKAVYEEMAVNDHNLTGMGSFTDLRLALQKHGVYPNLNTLRLLASTCVSTTEVGQVNYEKLLSFLIAAVRKSKDIPKQEPQTFYSPRGDGDPYSLQNDPVRSDGQLYRMIQQQLLQANATVNIEELRKVFGKADRLYRLTLSQPQIMEICRRVNVPISEAVIDMMLQHCETHGDGQYVWTDFVEILEKVQPHATGLPIPRSKRPLEYAKQYRQPNENWPHPNPTMEQPQLPQKQSWATNRIDREPSPVKESYDRQQTKSQELSIPKNARSLQHQNISAPAGLHGRSVSDSQISPRGLGVQSNSKPWSTEQPDMWFQGFRKLAEALYRNDLNRKGSMKPDQCKWLITEYNDIYDLRIEPILTEHCINRNTTISGTDIDGLLQSLLSAKQ